jgi:hypothetical protein
MNIRKLTFDGLVRYDFMLNGEQEHLSLQGITDAEAIEIIKAMTGVKSQVKPFQNCGGVIIQEWIPLEA